ncbi:MAG: large conductance mechanosensitive channel protein MscL [Fimbriimonadaceae bacterium]|nr:large conductance mechanosensitive channel protein MscL [Fimbriimonadaceae bacterium]
MLKEFRDFALGGNLLDVGIGFVIGAATAAFVGAFTSNLVTPWIALAGGGNMSSKFAILKAGKSGVAEYPSLAAAQADGAAVLSWGVFVDEFIKFLLIMFVMFLIVKMANKFKKEATEAPSGPSEVELLTEIRDALKSR